MSDAIKARELKRLVADLDDDADVIITMNGDPESFHFAYSANKNEEGDLVLDIVHYCDND